MREGVVISFDNGEGIIREGDDTEYRFVWQHVLSCDRDLIKRGVSVSFEIDPKSKAGQMPKAKPVMVLREALAPLAQERPNYPPKSQDKSLPREHTGHRDDHRKKHHRDQHGTKNRGGKKDSPPLRCDDNPLPFPYHFVPIPVDGEGNPRATVEAPPIFHHGANEEQSELVSGELRCTLTALTPLLVGNYQFGVKELDGASALSETRVSVPHIKDPVAAGKKVLAPLMLPDGRVLISGSSLKGMLRQSIGALLAAPMERVAERSYSYRPNIVYTRDHLKWSVATVERPPDKDTGENMEVRLMRTPREDNTNPFLSEAFDPKGKEEREGRVLRYLGGIDGNGLIHQIVNAAKQAGDADLDAGEKIGDPRRKLRVIPPDLRKAPIPVPADVVLHYWATLKHLADVDHGHISPRHPVVKEKREDNYRIASREELSGEITGLKTNALKKRDAIYIEYEQAADGKIIVRSIGQHFRYRLRYLDTVRTRWKGWISGSEERRILVPTESEKELLNGKPSQLTGARLLFGYVRDDGRDSGTKGIGDGNYKRLAGRVAFNTAVERTQDGVAAKDRFLNADRGFMVPLKTLGMPRPSAVECYLQQEPAPQGRTDAIGKLVTYGDLADDTSRGGELNGRKFYLHQPAAETDAGCYESADPEEKSGDQAPLASYVSKRGTQFRFTVRFRDLRKWELGAVLLALDPNLVEGLAGVPSEVTTYLRGIRGDAKHPLFAAKLGHGRPLGMGSVKIDVEHLLPWDDSQGMHGDQLKRDALAALWQFIAGRADPDTLVKWFKVHQYRGRDRAAYHTHNGEIFGFHTELRRQHAEARRQRNPSPNPCVLKPL